MEEKEPFSHNLYLCFGTEEPLEVASKPILCVFVSEVIDLSLLSLSKRTLPFFFFNSKY